MLVQGKLCTGIRWSIILIAIALARRPRRRNTASMGYQRGRDANETAGHCSALVHPI